MHILMLAFALAWAAPGYCRDSGGYPLDSAAQDRVAEAAAGPGEAVEVPSPVLPVAEAVPSRQVPAEPIFHDDFLYKKTPQSRGTSMDPNFLIILVGMFVMFFFALFVFLASRYRRCPSNKILVVYGRVAGGAAAKPYHGGGAFIWPLIQDYQYLDLTPLTISIPLKGALSLQNIRIDVPSTFTVAIDPAPATANNAAVRLLDRTPKQIEDMAMEIIFGQLRLTVASLTIEQINQDREKFLDAIRTNIDTELTKIGLSLINVNITDITDESGYIESIGKKAASTAVNQAKIDVAEEQKKGAIGEAAALKERRVQVAQFDAAAVEGENKSKAQVAAYNAELAEKEAEAGKRGEVAQQVARADIEKSKAAAETRRLEAEQVVPEEIAKRKVEIHAEADAEQKRRHARGEADAILSVKTAEAEGVQKVLNAKAQGYQALVAAAGKDPKDAATLLLVEKLEQIVKLQTETIRNIKFDKVTVWDSGGNGGGGAANFMSGMVKSLPPLHEVAKLAGVSLPEYLGNVKTAVQVKPPANGGDGKGSPKH